MPQLPVPPNSVWGASPSARTDGAGVLFYSVFAQNAQRVYKLVAGAAVEVPLEHACTARGRLEVDSDGALYLIGWDDRAAGLWRMKVPEWVAVQPPRGPAGPKGDTGPAGPPGAGSVLAEALRKALKAYLNAP